MFRVFGFFSWDRKVRKLRKRYDRLREHALKKHDPLRGRLLQRLDAINNSLTTMEETQLSRVDRARISKDVEISLEEVKALMKYPEEGEARAARAQQAA